MVRHYKQIEVRDRFVDAAWEEFLSKHPEVKGEWFQHLGGRVQDKGDGKIDQDAYIEKWLPSK